MTGLRTVLAPVTALVLAVAVATAPTAAADGGPAATEPAAPEPASAGEPSAGEPGSSTPPATDEVGEPGADGAEGPGVDRPGAEPSGPAGDTDEPTEPAEPNEPTEPADPQTEVEFAPEAGLGPAGEQVRRTRTLGRSVQGRPIKAHYRGAADPEHVLVVLGQMHGDEKAGTHTARWVRNNVVPKPGTGVWVVDTMNPDGNARGTRTNAHGVDLNRNWPTSGWQATTRGSRYWSGPEPGSEPEVRAMMRFLRRTKPDYVASIHQPLRGIGRSSHDVAWEKRLARQLGLPRKYFGIAQGEGVSPTLTGWYNHHFDPHGTATTIEYGAAPSQRYRTRVAGLGIARAARVR